jgi:peptide/nickel transport system substrate-binding protein
VLATTVPGSSESEDTVSGRIVRPATSGFGTVVVVVDEEPVTLGPPVGPPSSRVGGWVRNVLWEGLFAVDESEEVIPGLLASMPAVVADATGMTASFILRPDLTWSDGVALDAGVVAASIEVARRIAPDDPVYATMTTVDVTGSTAFSVSWSESSLVWQELLPMVFPVHVLPTDPDAAAELLATAIDDWAVEGVVLPSSGPLVLESWSRGTNMRLVGNPRHRSPTAIEAVLVRFVDGPEAALRAVERSEADLTVLDADAFIAARSAVEPSTVTPEPVEGVEVVALALDGRGPHASDRLVRQAVAMSLDLAGYGADVTFGETQGVTIGSSFWGSQQSEHVDRFGGSGGGGGRAVAARDLLQLAGYVFDEGGFAVHPDRGVLALEFDDRGGVVPATTAERIRRDLFVVGVATVEPSDPAAGRLSLVEMPVGLDPASRSRFITSLGELVALPPEFEAKAARCSRTFDLRSSAECHDDLDALVIDGEWVLLPLRQQRSVVVRSIMSTVRLPIGSVSWRSGPFVRIGEAIVESGR